MFDECPEVTFLLRTWINGGSALPAVRMMIENGYGFEAACTANVAMKRPDCDERDALLAVIGEVANTSDEWVGALHDFARNPSEERWDELFRFAPEEVFYQRLRHTIAILLALQCDGDILFRCAFKHGMTSDAFDGRAQRSARSGDDRGARRRIAGAKRVARSCGARGVRARRPMEHDRLSSRGVSR